MHEENKNKQLAHLLSGVQKEASHEEFIYGVTNRSSRSFTQRINDFFIDHSKVPLKEKAYFFELLGTLLRAGIPLNRALKILTGKTENPRLRRIIATLSYEIEHGRPLSASFDHFPETFEETERGVTRSAEAVGNLEQMLLKTADNLDRRAELIMKLVSAAIYPALVLVALIVGIAVMFIFVVPKIRDIFTGSALELPLPTQILLGLSEFVEHQWWLVAIIVIFAIVGWHLYTHSEDGHFAWDFRKLRIPVLGALFRKIFVLRFVGTLGLLVESGLPINQALAFVAGTVGNEVYRVKIFEALARVQEGEKLSAVLAEAPFLFPETVNNMIAVGEQSASLGDITLKLEQHYQREIDHSINKMTNLFGPVLVVFIGLAVIFFALAVLSPIFSLTEAVQ